MTEPNLDLQPQQNVPTVDEQFNKAFSQDLIPNTFTGVVPPELQDTPIEPIIPKEKKKAPALSETLKATIRQESSLGSYFAHILTPRDEKALEKFRENSVVPLDFNPLEGLDFKYDPKNFVDLLSPQEVEAMKENIDQQKADMKTISESGTGINLLSNFVALGFSPEQIAIGFVPLVNVVAKGASIGKGALQIGAGAGLGTIANESVLQKTQELRTLERGATNTVVASLLGGILGGVGAKINKDIFKNTVKKIEEEITGNVDSHGRYSGEVNQLEEDLKTLQTDSGGEVKGSMGAAARFFSETKEGNEIVKSFGVAGALKQIDPLVNLLSSNFTEGRILSQLLFENTLFLEKFKEGKTLGTAVETAIKTSGDELQVSFSKHLNNGFVSQTKKLKEGQDAGVLAPIIQQGKDSIRGAEVGALNSVDFNERVGIALRNGDMDKPPSGQTENKFVTITAQNIRRDVINVLKKRLVDSKLLDKDAVAQMADTYFHRMYSREAISNNVRNAEGQNFREFVSSFLLKKLKEDEKKNLEAYQNTLIRVDTLNNIVEVDGKAVQKQIDEVNLELDKFNVLEGADVQPTLLFNEKQQKRVKVLSEESIRLNAKIGVLTEQAKTATSEKEVRKLLNEIGNSKQQLAKKETEASSLTEELIQKQISITEKDIALLKQREKLVGAKDFENRLSDKKLRKEFLQSVKKTGDGEAFDIIPIKQEEKISKLENEVQTLRDDLKSLQDKSPTVSKASEKTKLVREIVQKKKVLQNVERKKRTLIQKTKGNIKSKLNKELSKLKKKKRKLNSKGFAKNVAKKLEKAQKRAKKLRLKVEEPERVASEQARAIEKNILNIREGQSDFLVDRITMAGSLRDKVLPIEDNLLQDWLVNDVGQVMMRQIHSLTAEIEMQKAFPGDNKLVNQTSKLRGLYSSEIEKLKKEGKTKEAKKLKSEADKILGKKELGYESGGQLQGLINILYGRYPTRQNPSDVALRIGQGFRDFTYITKLGKVLISSLPDPAKLIMSEGLTGVAGLMIKAAKAPTEFKLSLKESEKLGFGTDLILNQTQKALSDINSYTAMGTKFEKGLHSITNAFSLATFLPLWNSILKQITGVMVVDNIIETSLKVAKGKASKKEIENLAQRGISTDSAINIAEEFLAGGGRKENNFHIIDIDRWSSEEMKTLIQNSTRKEVDTVVVTPGVADRPLLLSTNLGKTISQFKAFAFASNNRTLIPGLQRHDLATLNGFMAMTFLGSISYGLRQRINGRDITDNKAVIISESTDRSGAFGVVGEALLISEKLTGGRIGLNNFFSLLTGDKNVRLSRGASRNITGTILGPNIGTGEDIVKIIEAMANPQNISNAQINALERMIPFLSLFYFAKLRSIMDKTLKDNLVKEK